MGSWIFLICNAMVSCIWLWIWLQNQKTEESIRLLNKESARLAELIDANVKTYNKDVDRFVMSVEKAFPKEVAEEFIENANEKKKLN